MHCMHCVDLCTPTDPQVTKIFMDNKIISQEKLFDLAQIVPLLVNVDF